MMDSRQLLFFLEVAQQKNFTKAAENLKVAQPAVSMAIKKLEEELGLSLFNRHSKKVSLTAEGIVLQRHAIKIRQQMEAAQMEMEELHGLVRGEVRVGVSSMLGSYYLPKVLIAFKKQYPQLRFSIHAAGVSDIQRLITNGELDMGVILPDKNNHHFETTLLTREEMVACVHPSHRFAQYKQVRYEEFAKEPLIMFKRGYFQRDLVEEVCAQQGITLQVILEANLIPVIKTMVKEKFGIASFLRIVVAEDSELVGVPFDPPIYLDLSLSRKKGAYLSKANQAFWDFLQNQFREQ